MRPSPLIELGVKKDWLAIEMGNEDVINLAAIDHPQDCNHRFGRFKSAHVNMHSIGRAPHPVALRCLYVAHVRLNSLGAGILILRPSLASSRKADLDLPQEPRVEVMTVCQGAMEAAMASTSGKDSVYPTVEPILNAIAEWVKKYRYAAGLRDELARCGPQEIANTARELGIGSDELYKLASKGPHAADLLQKMLRALGVDPKVLAAQDPIAMRDLQRLCIMCDHKKQCRHELAAGTAARNYHDFCPNAFTLDALFDAK